MHRVAQQFRYVVLQGESIRERSIKARFLVPKVAIDQNGNTLLGQFLAKFRAQAQDPDFGATTG